MLIGYVQKLTYTYFYRQLRKIATIVTSTYGLIMFATDWYLRIKSFTLKYLHVHICGVILLWSSFLFWSSLHTCIISAMDRPHIFLRLIHSNITLALLYAQLLRLWSARRRDRRYVMHIYLYLLHFLFLDSLGTPQYIPNNLNTSHIVHSNGTYVAHTPMIASCATLTSLIRCRNTRRV